MAETAQNGGVDFDEHRPVIFSAHDFLRHQVRELGEVENARAEVLRKIIRVLRDGGCKQRPYAAVFVESGDERGIVRLARLQSASQAVGNARQRIELGATRSADGRGGGGAV